MSRHRSAPDDFGFPLPPRALLKAYFHALPRRTVASLEEVVDLFRLGSQDPELLLDDGGVAGTMLDFSDGSFARVSVHPADPHEGLAEIRIESLRLVYGVAGELALLAGYRFDTGTRLPFVVRGDSDATWAVRVPEADLLDTENTFHVEVARRTGLFADDPVSEPTRPMDEVEYLAHAVAETGGTATGTPLAQLESAGSLVGEIVSAARGKSLRVLLPEGVFEQGAKVVVVFQSADPTRPSPYFLRSPAVTGRDKRLTLEVPRTGVDLKRTVAIRLYASEEPAAFDVRTPPRPRSAKRPARKRKRRQE